jgi:hypothetical protein
MIWRKSTGRKSAMKGIDEHYQSCEVNTDALFEPEVPVILIYRYRNPLTSAHLSEQQNIPPPTGT